jgi:VCBS repeat-containing protein
MSNILGTQGADSLLGGAGDDTLQGLDGSDRLAGGGGNDVLIGNAGDSLIDGGAGIDLAQLDFSGATSSLRYTVGSSSQALPGAKIQSVEQVSFTGGSLGDWLTGGALNDSLDGRNGNDWLKGGDGDDLLLGGDGIDILEGGAGADTLDGESGYDQMTGGDGDDLMVIRGSDVLIDGGAGRDHAVVELGYTSADINFSIAANLSGAGNIQGTRVAGFESLTFNAGSGDDTLGGGAFADTLNGAGGDDVLTGGGGDDLLNAGAGVDTVRFSGKLSDYSLTVIDAETVRLSDLHGGDGADVIKGAERFAFSDGTLTFGELVSGQDNRPPVAAPDAAVTNEDGAVFIDVLANDTDPDTIDVRHVVGLDDQGLQGTASVISGGILYTPGTAHQALAEGESAQETFSYVMADDKGATSTAQVTVTINGANDAPTVQDEYASLTEDGAAVIRLLDNDLDVDHGDSISLASVTAGARGSVQVGEGGAVTYRPTEAAQFLNAGESVQDSFTYVVKDSHGATTTATAHVTIFGANDAPTAVADTLTISKTGPAVFANLMANDSDLDRGDAISITSVQGTSASGASVVLGPNGQVTYDPGQIFAGLEPGKSATDAFTYVLTDSHGAQSSATVHLTISGGSEPESDLSFVTTINEDESTANLYGRIVDTAEELYGPGADVIAVDTAGTLGSVALGEDSLVYTADDDLFDRLWADGHMNTEFRFTVQVADGSLHTGRFAVFVGGTNDAPVAQDDALSVISGGAATSLWTKLLANDLDADAGQYHGITEVDATGALGRVAFNAATRSLTYYADTDALDDLAPGQTVVDHFTYTMVDGMGATSQASVSVTVTGGEGWAVG